MAILYEHYNVGDDNSGIFDGDNWTAQTFTPATTHYITSVKLLLYRQHALNIGDVTVSIRATDGVRPVGLDLTSGILSCELLPVHAVPWTGLWLEIPLTPYTLIAGTKYAIVVRKGAGGDLLCWRWDQTLPTYLGGQVCISTDGGSTWLTDIEVSGASADWMFEEWGVLVVVPTVTTNSATGIAVDYSTLNGTLVDDGGEACDCGFQWGETPALGKTTPTQSKNTGDVFSQGISPLMPGRTYYFRAFATNAEGTGYGDILSFTTLTVGVDASVLTLPATLITEHTARIHGMVADDAGHWGYVRFQWGGIREYGAETPWMGGYVTGDKFYADLTNLTEGMGYHFRAQFKHTAGIVSGRDMVFNTLVPLGPVTLIPEDLAYLLEASV